MQRTEDGARLTMKKRVKSAFDHIYPDSDRAADLTFRADMIRCLVDYAKAQQLTARQLAVTLEIPESRAMELLEGRINLLSSKRLIAYLSRLGFRLRPVFIPATARRAASIKGVVDQVGNE